MITKFNKFERVAGLFVLTAILGAVGAAIGVAVKQGWFETKTYYTTTFENADGVHQGTVVQMAGLRAGAVEDVELLADNRIQVKFYVLGKFTNRVRQDSVAQLIRPFIIGERLLDLSVGTETAAPLAQGEPVLSTEALDLMSIISGKKMNQYFSKVGGLLENIEVLLNAFKDKGRAETIVRIFDRLDPLLKNLNTMSTEVTKLSRQVNKDDNLQLVLQNLAVTTAEINRILPDLNAANPEMAKDLAVMTQNLAMMTKALGPAMKTIEPELPRTSQRLVEALDETVVVLKAMQKSFLMKSNAQEVREEEAQRRLPASQDLGK